MLAPGSFCFRIFSIQDWYTLLSGKYQLALDEIYLLGAKASYHQTTDTLSNVSTAVIVPTTQESHADCSTSFSDVLAYPWPLFPTQCFSSVAIYPAKESSFRRRSKKSFDQSNPITSQKTIE